MYTKLFCTWEYILLSHQYVFKYGLFQLSGGTSCLFTTLIWQVIERVHVVYSSWFSWRYESLPRFGIGGPRFFPRVAATMISKRFVKLGIIVYFWILQKIWNKDDSYIITFIIYPSCERALKNERGKWKIRNRLWTILLVRAAVLYQTLLDQTQTKPYWSKFS